MDLSQSTLFQMLKARMDHSAVRQKVLSENVANATTPDFVSSDVRDLSFKHHLREATGLTPVKTSTAHLDGTRRPNKFRTEQPFEPIEVMISGNAVDVEDEMVKMAQTAGLYDLTTKLYKKNADMVKLAIKAPQ